MMLDSKETWVREGALRILMNAPQQPKVPPKLVHLAISDPSLDVRTLALEVIDNWTTNRFRALETDELQRWWDTEGKKEFPIQ